MLAYLDNTSEALAGIQRSGNAAAHNAGNHLRVLQLALAQLWRAKPILVRADTAGASRALLDDLTASGLEYSIGHRITEPLPAAIR